MAPLSTERIVATALAEIEHGGHEQLSLRGVARTLGVSAAALYEYVDSKADLLRQVAIEGYLDLSSHFGLDSDIAVERCKARSMAYIDFARRRPELFRTMCLFPPEHVAVEAGSELAVASGLFEEGAKDIQQAIYEGDLLDQDPLRINLTLWAAAHGAATVAVMAPPLADPMVEDFISAVYRGLHPG